MEFPRCISHRNRPPAHQQTRAYPNNPVRRKTTVQRFLPQPISRRAWIPPGPRTLSDWGLRAKRLGRSLDAYTPAPSTPSSMGALVQPETTVASDPKWARTVVYFREGFQA